MCHQYRISDKFEKLRQDRLDIRRFHNHVIGNARQVRNFKRNRHFRIDKCTEFVSNHSIFHLYSTNLDNLVLD